MHGPWFTEALAAERVADLQREAAQRSGPGRPRLRLRLPFPSVRRRGWLRTPAVAGCGA